MGEGGSFTATSTHAARITILQKMSSETPSVCGRGSVLCPHSPLCASPLALIRRARNLSHAQTSRRSKYIHSARVSIVRHARTREAAEISLHPEQEGLGAARSRARGGGAKLGIHQLHHSLVVLVIILRGRLAVLSEHLGVLLRGDELDHVVR